MQIIVDIFSQIRLKMQPTTDISKKIKTILKGQILLNKGDIATKTYYVHKGLLRSYTIDEKGKEHIFMFAPEDWIMTDMVSQTYQTPSDLFIDALEDTEVEILDREIFFEQSNLELNSTSSEVQKLRKRAATLQKRVLLLMSATAKERYEDFIKTYPNIVQRVPQKMIASYLGITPEALSKIRGDIVRKK